MELDSVYGDIDPDYKRNNLPIYEVKNIEDSFLDLNGIFVDEFDRELNIRQQQLEEIERNLFKLRRLLYLMRYALVSSYYKKRNLEYAGINEQLPDSSFDPQSRIHPAVRKLLGNNNYHLVTAQTKRKVHKINENIEYCSSFNAKRIQLKRTENIKYPREENVGNFLRRKKTKHRILIGNISKWMPSLENDNTTHKWMVYVRGLKEAPNLSDLIEKVIFYLHPSYEPHNIVEVCEYPFHLSRRGWGEFPLRVEIYFKCTLNKPISIVHNLKLDKTYSGRQTLGNETIVDIYLHGRDDAIKLASNVLPSGNNFNGVNDKNPIPDDLTMKMDYNNENDHEDKSLLDHTYSLPHETSSKITVINETTYDGQEC